jgi:hypothetical protein
MEWNLMTLQRTISLLAAGLLSLMASQSAQAALIANWQFDTYGGGALSAFHPDAGAQSATAIANASVAGSPLPVLSHITGTTVNQTTASAPNNALQVQSGANGSSFTLTLQVSGTGLSGFVVTYASGDNSVPGYTQTWSYSIDGTTFTSLPTTINAANTTTFNGTAYTADFSAITALNGAANVYFRDTIALGNNDQVRFDNIAINAVPEPVNVALGVFGFCAVVGGVGRRYLRNRS